MQLIRFKEGDSERKEYVKWRILQVWYNLPLIRRFTLALSSTSTP